MKSFRYIEGVVTLAFDVTRCIGCGACEMVCPHGVFRVEGKPLRATIVDRDGCIECGACAVNCPADAVSVTPGVGCAAYIIASWLGRCSKGCC